MNRTALLLFLGDTQVMKVAVSAFGAARRPDGTVTESGIPNLTVVYRAPTSAEGDGVGLGLTLALSDGLAVGDDEAGASAFRDGEPLSAPKVAPGDRMTSVPVFLVGAGLPAPVQAASDVATRTPIPVHMMCVRMIRLRASPLGQLRRREPPRIRRSACRGRLDGVLGGCRAPGHPVGFSDHRP
jgi:hypothetical protein